MKTPMRTLILSAAALAALVVAPTSNAEGFRRGGTHAVRPFRGETFRGPEFRGREFRGGEFRGRAFLPRPAFFPGRRFVAPARVFAGSRFYSYCPGPGYVYVDDFGWVFPPFPGAVWIAPHAGRFGVRIGGFWR